MDWLTSDQHYYHERIIVHAKRPFETVGEMNETLVRNHNSVVKPSDRVFMVGDFSMKCTPEQAARVAARLHGQKFIVWGNHDKSLRNCQEFLKHFQWARDYAEVDVRDPLTNVKKKLVLCHYALRVWNKSHHGSWHAYGHSHGSLPDDPHALSMDVGVDPNHYYPISLADFAKRMSEKTFVPADRHGAD